MNTSNPTAVCPPPFLLLNDFPYVAGQKDGRFCAPLPDDPMVMCCLPCPLTDWVYPDNFTTISEVASWLGVGTLACCVILLLSFAILPAQRTGRHYLTICVIASVLFLELAFTIPLGTKPDQCYDAITPNDLHTNVSCAVSGIFLLGGGFGAVIWVFIRSLSVHLQICWKIVPGDVFFYLAQFAGWGLTALFLALSLTLSGVSYRLGSTCHINHDKSVGTFWGPLLGFAGASLLLQLFTFIYCLKVYLQFANGPAGALPTTTTNLSTQYTASGSGSNSGNSTVVKRATYKRVRKVVALQWRGMAVVCIVIITAIYLAIAFLLLDADVSRVAQNYETILPWVVCIAKNQGNKTPCLGLTSPFIVPERVVLPVLYLIAIIGFWALIFLGKWDMVHGWIDLLGTPFRRSRSRSSSPNYSDRGSSIRVRSQESFSDRLRATPQQLHIIKSERGFSVANKAETKIKDSTWNIELMRSPTPNSSTNNPFSPDEPNFPHNANRHSDFNYSLSSKDIESSGYSYNYSISGSGSGSNQSQNHSHSQSHPNLTRTPSYPQSARLPPPTRPLFPIVRDTPPPTTFEGVWAAPATTRRSFNFSRPSTAQVPVSPPSRQQQDPSGWYMSPHPPVDEDLEPLTDSTGNSVGVTPKLRTPQNTRNPTPRRFRANSDSRASSVYSLAGVLGIGRGGVAPQRPSSRNGERPSQGMAWDPASSFAGSAQGQRTQGQTGRWERDGSPALGRGQGW